MMRVIMNALLPKEILQLKFLHYKRWLLVYLHDFIIYFLNYIDL